MILDSFIDLTKRRILIIVTCTIVGLVGSGLLAGRQIKKYEASAALLFRDPGLGSDFFGGSVLNPSSDPTRAAATNLKLVTSPEVATATATALGGGLTAATVAQEVSAGSEGNSDLVTVSATDPDPVLATRIANEYVKQFVVARREADRAKVMQARSLVLGQLKRLAPDAAEAVNLRKSADQLLTLAALQTGNAEVARRATPPSSYSSPQVKRAALLGFAVGLLLGYCIAVLLDQFDRRLRDPYEAERLLRAPLLGTVAESRALARTVGHDAPDRIGADLEPFAMINTNLRYLDVDRAIRSVVVTSGQPMDGKTTTAWNVAAAAARSGATVLLLEADLRQPTIAERSGLPTKTGLSSVLAGITDIDAEIVSFPVAADTDRTLDVLPAGPAPPNPGGLLESDRMRDLLEYLKARYDLVVIDTPPLAAVADAISLMHHVDGVIAVVRLGQSRLDTIGNMRSQLTNVGATLLGVVVNGGKPAAHYLRPYREHAA